VLEQNIDKIFWYYLSSNKNAIHLLKKNIDKVIWFWISFNPSIFEIDYKYLKERMDIIREELMMKTWHPTKIKCYLDLGYDIDDI
jgi:hypothetical protein